MNYIYEMDVAMLRVGYIIPEGLICFKVSTKMYNWAPYDPSKMEMVYEIQVTDMDFNADHHFFRSFEGTSLQQVVEIIRKHFIEHPYKQPPVSKSPDDGTDSVITTR